jgi:hypothetical protein
MSKSYLYDDRREREIVTGKGPEKRAVVSDVGVSPVSKNVITCETRTRVEPRRSA